MKVTRTEFDYNYHFSQTCSCPCYDYVRHNVDVWNYIKIGDVELCALYQTGNHYKHGDVRCPSEELELSEEGGAHPLLIAIDRLNIADIETRSDEAKCALEMLKEVVQASDWSTLELLKKELEENKSELCVEHYLPDDLVTEG